MTATIVDSEIFRDIFATEAMRAIFADEHRIQAYLDIEAALARVQARLGVIPDEASDEINRHCRSENFDIALMKQQTELIGYPVLPLVQQLVERCHDGLGEWCHWGATTQDITDTATVLQVREGLTLLETELDAIREALATLALNHRDTPMAGRSNLQQALPITFGYKMSTLLAAFDRHKDRLAESRRRVLVGEFAGAAGTLASLGEQGLEVQAALMTELDLDQPEIAWHTVRDRVAEVGCFLGLLTGTCAKLALDVKLMMQSEVGEAFEPFEDGRGSSSTMPQKRNPISSAYIGAATSVIRQHVSALLNAMEADHERSTGPWEIEWIVLPEIFALSAGVLAQTRVLVQGLEVDAEAMQKNLALSNGLIVSEAVMMRLGPHLGRQSAHDRVYALCREVLSTGRTLLDLLSEDPEVTAHLDRAELEELCDPANYLGQAGEMVDRVLAQRGRA